MNLSAENIGKIRDLVRSGYPLKTRDAKDLQGHNDHLIELLEARGRLMLGVEIERDQLRAEIAGLKTGYEAYERVNAELKAENETLRAKLECPDPILIQSLDSAIADYEQLEKNATRYRWLREARRGYIKVVEWIGPHATGMTGEDLDALLDAAMGKGEQS